MKHTRTLRLTTLVCALILTFASFAPAALAENQHAMVKGGNLYLRAEKTPQSAALGLYPPGTWVEVLEYGRAWCYVRTADNKTGYMATNYLVIDNLNVLATGYIQNPNGFVNLRSYASLNAPILGRYDSGTSVEILSRANGWTQVVVGGQTGYMVSEFVISNHVSQTAHITTKYGGRVNLRTAPASTANVITSLPTGTRVTILLHGSAWHKVSAEGYTGYVAAQYVSTSSSGTYTYATVNNPRPTQVLNLRETPSLDARVLGYYYNGTQVRVVSKGSTWSEVYIGNLHGYMMNQYLNFGGISGTTATLYNPNGNSIVNMRAEASLYSAIIGVYPVGTRVTILRSGTDWTYVTIGSQSGYVSSYFLRY